MSNLSSISTSFASRAAQIAGSAFCAEGVVQLVHSQHTGARVIGVSGHLNLGFFIVALLFGGAAVIGLARYARPGPAQTVAQVVAGGMALLGLTCVSSLVMGHDGVWFNVIAPLTNAAWLFGSIVLSVSVVRAHRAPRYIALGLPIAWLGTIPLATLGGGIVSGAYFLALGALLGARTAGRVIPAAELV